jgi:hypothetical protein
VVERQSPKLKVVGSNPTTRVNINWCNFRNNTFALSFPSSIFPALLPFSGKASFLPVFPQSGKDGKHEAGSKKAEEAEPLRGRKAGNYDRKRDFFLRKFIYGKKIYD